MILSCSKCSRRYLISDTLFNNAPRQVRCGGCGHVWFQEYQATPVIPSADHTSPAFSPVSNSPITVQKPKNSHISWGWLFYWLFIISCFLGVIVGRNTIARKWPVTASIYHALGLNIVFPGQDLSVQNLEVRSISEAAPDTVVVKGEIVNNGHEQRAVPALRIIFRRAEVKEHKQKEHKQKDSGAPAPQEMWLYQPTQKTLLAGEAMFFETSPRKLTIGTLETIESHAEFVVNQ